MSQSPRGDDTASEGTERLSAALAGRYRIERRLGQGGMATVYLAQDLKHDRHVAIKVLKPELSAVLGADRFVVEIKTTAALQHPHILPLFDSGTADGFLYYVMPYIEGETLRDKLSRETQFSVDEAVRITVQVADALDYAHRHGVIHRDIKPENILLHDGRPMVADFGIALAVSAAAGGRMTETGLSLGTPHYMSPEQATADKDITARSDIYSLASVLYEMLAGQPPHMGNSAQMIIMRIIAEPVETVTKFRKSVPPNVAAALTRALEKLPADRFETAKAFSDALTDVHFAERGLAGKHAGGTTAGPWRLRFYALSAVTALMAIALVVSMRRTTSATLQASVSQLTYSGEFVLRARFAPDGKTMAFSSQAGAGLAPRLFVVRPDYPEPQRLGPDSTQLLAISSTGELAVLTHAQPMFQRLALGTLARMPLGGGSPRDVVDRVIDADWSPDGSRLAVVRMDSTNATHLEYPIGHALYHSKPGGHLSDIRISPAGDRIAFFDHGIIGDNRGTVTVVDTNGTTSVLTGEFWGLDGLAWARDGKAIVFAGADRGGMFQVHRAAIGGGERLALPAPGYMTLQDVARDGTWLITRDDYVQRILVRAPHSTQVRDLSWLDLSALPLLSRDGLLMAFNDQSQQGGLLYGAMVRRTDGSPAVRLGDGIPIAISPDNKWILATVPTTPIEHRLYPTGAGQARVVHWNLDGQVGTGFFPDGLHLFVCGAVTGKARACYRSTLDGSDMQRVTPDSVFAGTLRPDGGAVAYSRAGAWWVRTLADSQVRRIPNLPANYRPKRWSPDGAALWGSASSDPRVMERVEVVTGRRTPLVTVQAAGQGVDPFWQSLTLADDPNVYAVSAGRQSSLIFSIRNPP